MLKNKKIIRLTESDLHSIIKESVSNLINELSPLTHGGAYVKSANNMKALKDKLNNGEKTMKKGNRTVDVANELERKQRQNKAFQNRFGGDINMGLNQDKKQAEQNLLQRIKTLKQQFDIAKNGNDGEWQNLFKKYYHSPNQMVFDSYRQNFIEDIKKHLDYCQYELNNLRMNKDGKYNVYNDGNGEFTINTPNSTAYSNAYGHNLAYSNPTQKNVSDASRLQDVTDAMSGYYNELNGNIDSEIDKHNKEKLNYNNYYKNRELYDNEKQQHQNYSDYINRKQNEYDNMPFYKKMFNKRPSSPQEFNKEEPALMDNNGKAVTRNKDTVDYGYNRLNNNINQLKNNRQNYQNKLNQFRNNNQ